MNRYVEDLMNGTYLQQTVESVVGNEAGKQLMVKMIFSYDRIKGYLSG